MWTSPYLSKRCGHHLEVDLLTGKGLSSLILKQYSRPTAAKAKRRRFSDTYTAPSKACEKKLPVFSSRGGPLASMERPAFIFHVRT
jgi:hypothetical protein